MRNLKISLLALVVIGTSACGNIAGNSNPYNIGTGYNSYTSGGGQSTLGSANWSDAQQCSENPNVVEQGYSTNTMNFRACADGSMGIDVYPENNASQTVCVFPLQGSTVISSNPNASDYASRYVYQCVNTGEDGATASFSVSFSAVYIVNISNLETFAACLTYGNLAACASQTQMAYAYGLVQ